MPQPVRLLPTLLAAASLLFLTISSPASAAGSNAEGDREGAVTASATRDTVDLRLSADPGGPVRVHAVAAWEDGPTAGNLIFEGAPGERVIRLPRAGDTPDPLYRRLVVLDAAGEPLGSPLFVTDFRALKPARTPLPWPASIKGVSNPEGGVDDLLALGVRHVHINLLLNDLLLPEGAPDPGPGFERTVDGEKLRFSPAQVAEWDAEIRGLSDAGINVIAVILNHVPEEGQNGDLLHPLTDVEGSPTKLVAFNTTDRRGVASLVGGLAFLADRYSDPSSEHGVIGGYILGNEVDSHWSWHNLGEATADVVIAQYAGELRLAWLAIRSEASEPKLYVSLTHSWDRPNSRSPLKNFSGKALLEGLTAASRADGDFGWDVAYHPYPQNLFEPRFWNDELAMFGYDTPMITYKNVEVLPAWLRREENLVNGEPRRVIFSEQGLHMPDGAEGEEVQAAAYALAHHRIENTPGIDAHILHRHVDHPREAGLKVGVRHLPPADGSAPYGAKKKSWEVFRVAGTPAFESEASFALAHAGYGDWSEADPKPGPFPEHAPEWGDRGQARGVHYDLLAKIEEARFENTLQARERVVSLPDGGMAESLMIHPLPPDQPAATGTWDVPLPADRPAKLVFKTYVPDLDPSGDGCDFRVLVGDDVLFEREVTNHTMDAAEVDLSAWAGKTIPLTLEVGARGGSNYDEAQFLSPAVVLGE